MNKGIGIWVFGTLGILTDLIAAAILFMMLIMPAQAFFLWQFMVGLVIFIILFLSSIVGLFKLKKWGRNIFLVITILLNAILIWFFSPMVYIYNLIITLFLSIFICYFILPSTRRLFNGNKQ